jgi:multidrug efflux pump subunit AcrB
MLAIVHVALNKPYTIVVTAMLIVIFGVSVAIKTPTDFFPKIGIPVVGVVSTYIGLPLADADAPRALGMADA